MYSVGEPRVPIAATGPVKMTLRLPPYVIPEAGVGDALVEVGWTVAEVVGTTEDGEGAEVV